MVRRIYVLIARVAKGLAEATGVIHPMERSNSQTVRWLRSLLSIYDSADMVRLDVPWWTYSAIEKVAAYINEKGGDVRVFEYGSGASTIWLARRCNEVITVEHDLLFVDHMQPLYGQYSNVTLVVRPPKTLDNKTHAVSKRRGYETKDFDNYVNSIEEFKGQFDIIVIDGRSRIFCLARALKRLNTGGLVVFDNSERLEYRTAIANSGLKETTLRGRAPALPYMSQTSILEEIVQ
jgi:hypothetical protein